MTSCAGRPLWVLALGMLLVLSGCRKPEPKEEEEHHAAPVKWEPAEKTTVEEWTELLGTTQPLPDRAAQISASVAGPVLSFVPNKDGKPLAEGQRVKAGQPLVRLDDHLVRATRDKLQSAKAEAAALARQAAYAVELANLDLRQLEKLQPTGSGGTLPLVTQLQLDKARVTLRDAEAKQKAAAARQDSVKAELKAVEEEAALYTLSTPIAGVLGLIRTMPGQSLAAGAHVADVVDLSEIDILCYVPAQTVARLKRGQPARLVTGGGPPEGSVGHVEFIGVQAQPETGTVAVKVRFPNADLSLRANTLHRIQVLTASKKDVWVLPEEALMEDQDPPAVLVVTTVKNKDTGKEEQRAVKCVVKVGLRDRGHWVKNKKGEDEEERHVEVTELKNAKTKEVIPVTDKTLVIVEGGAGLEEDELVTPKKEEHEEEHKDDKDKDEKKDDKDKAGKGGPG